MEKRFSFEEKPKEECGGEDDLEFLSKPTLENSCDECAKTDCSKKLIGPEMKELQNIIRERIMLFIAKSTSKSSLFGMEQAKAISQIMYILTNCLSHILTAALASPQFEIWEKTGKKEKGKKFILNTKTMEITVDEYMKIIKRQIHADIAHIDKSVKEGKIEGIS